MPRSLTHVFLSQEFPEAPNQPGLFIAHDIPLRINRVGRLEILVQAKLVTKIPPLPSIPGVPPPATPPGRDKGFTISPFNFQKILLDPDGNPFAKDFITLEDLNKYRDLRGFVRQWTLRILRSDNPPNQITNVDGPRLFR